LETDSKITFKLSPLIFEIMYVKVAKQKGAEIVRDIWEESDEYGIVRMATVKTVNIKKMILPYIICDIIAF